MTPSKTITPRQALAKAEELCSRAEHCTGEIRQKLWKWGIPADDAEKIIDSLTSRRFIDDARFARIFARGKVIFNRWGRLKIKAALSAKHLDPATIAEALSEIDPGEYTKALQATIEAKRRSTPDANTYEGRTRIFRHAASRGFEPELIIKTMRECRQD